MTSDQWIIAGLLVLLCFEKIWHTITMTRLINRLMSRNYSSYVESEKKLREPRVIKQTVKPPQLNDDIAHDVNAAFNGLPL